MSTRAYQRRFGRLKQKSVDLPKIENQNKTPKLPIGELSKRASELMKSGKAKNRKEAFAMLKSETHD